MTTKPEQTALTRRSFFVPINKRNPMHQTITRLQDLARQALRERPDLTMDILESMQLSASEISQGGSPEHELELLQNHLNELKGTP